MKTVMRILLLAFLCWHTRADDNSAILATNTVTATNLTVFMAKRVVIDFDLVTGEVTAVTGHNVLLRRAVTATSTNIVGEIQYFNPLTFSFAMATNQYPALVTLQTQFNAGLPQVSAMLGVTNAPAGP